MYVGHEICVHVPAIGNGATATYYCDRPIISRYVLVYMTDRDPLHICELQVMADHEPYGGEELSLS